MRPGRLETATVPGAPQHPLYGRDQAPGVRMEALVSHEERIAAGKTNQAFWQVLPHWHDRTLYQNRDHSSSRRRPCS
jgi:hypothetical protein